jgi:hypothetical protein
MKLIKTALILSVLVLGLQISHAQGKGFGLGIIIGEPTGLSAKLWTSGRTALDFGLGWSVFNNHKDSGTRIHFHADYLWHSWNAINSTERFPLYYGIGGRFNSHQDNDGSLAVRGVLGIAWLPHNTPLDLFIEVAPSLEITPSSGFGIDAAIGVRYYFN